MVKASDVYGGRYKQARLEVEQVEDARRRLGRGEAQRSIARDLGVNQSTVSRISNEKRWKGK